MSGPRDGRFGASDDRFAAAVCPECKAVVAPGAHYCGACGACDDVQAAGRQVAAESNFGSLRAVYFVGAALHVVLGGLGAAGGAVEAGGAEVAAGVALVLCGAVSYLSDRRLKTHLPAAIGAIVVHVLGLGIAVLGLGVVTWWTLVGGAAIFVVLLRVAQVGALMARVHARR